MRSVKRQRGVTIVEFALVGLLVFIVLFGCLEFGRALYTYNSLTEGTRRGARLAAVCPRDDPAIAAATIFDGTGVGFPNLTTANVVVDYLDEAGATTALFSSIAYVRVSITGYELPLNIPVLNPTITMPAFSTTLPRESLGLNPDTGTRPPC